VAPSNASLILLVILALLFLLLSLCCLFYFCLKCRCFRGRGLLYREPLFTYRKGAWPWSTLEASSSSESGADFSALSASHDLYPEIGIPRAKLKQHHSSSSDHQHHLHHLDASAHLHGYLDNNEQWATHIPRARLDIPIRHQRTSSDGFDSSSQSSSEYTIREEVERRITTDVTKTETRKTVTADVHDSATAHFHVYPPIEPPSLGAETSRQAEMVRNNIAGLVDQEQERGESVAEFSIGNAGWQSSHMRNCSNGGDKHRQLSSTEFLNTTDRDAESVASDEGVSYDKKVLVTRNMHPTGEHLRSEITTTTTSHSTKSLQH